jgi:hypothetical protein
MKKVFFVFLLVLFTRGAVPQEKPFFDAAFGAGGGFTPAWMIPDFSALNEKVVPFKTDEFSKSGFFAFGGGGFVYIGFVKNLRVGGMGMEGATKQTKIVTYPSGVDFRHEVEYTSSFGGVTIEYTLPYFRKTAVSLGAVIGGGMTRITVARHAGAWTWDKTWQDLADPNSLSASYSRTLQHSYFTLVPTINIDYPVYRFVSLRLGAGYSIPIGTTWAMDGDIEFNGVPDTAPSGGLFITSGVYFGFFSY